MRWIGMSDAIGLDMLESIPALSLAGGMESRQQNQDRQGTRGGSGVGRADSVKLSPEAEKQVQKLLERDREVRAHEQAHIAAGGRHVSGGASFTYQTGPDGRQYAVGGLVQIDASPVPGDPKATEEKARAVRRAALAPASPSATDQNVAAKAAAMENRARSEQAEQAEDAGQGGVEGAGRLRRHAAAAYGRLDSPFHGAASWQRSAGNSSFFFGVHSGQPWPDQERAAAIYAAMQGLQQTALVPYGTGISFVI